MRSAVRKRLSEADSDDAYATAGALFKLSAFAVITVCVLGVRSLLNSAHDIEILHVVITYGPLLVGALFVNILYSFVSTVLNGQHRVHISALTKPVERTMRSAIQIGVVFLSFGVTGLLVGYVIAGLVASALSLVFITLRFERPQRHHFERLFSYAKYAWLGGLTSRAFNAMDTAVLGVFVSAGLMGAYEIAWNIASVFAIFGVTIGSALFPEMSQLSSEANSERVVNLLNDALAFTGLFIIPGFVGALLIGDRVLAIYGEEFAKGHLVLVVLIAGRLVYAYGGQLLTTANAIDHPEIAFRVNGVFAASNIILNIGLVWAYGWTGAAVATTVSGSMTLLGGYWYLNRIINVTIPVWELARQWFAAALMAAVIYVGTLYASSGWPTTISLVAVGGIIYFGVLLGISDRFRETVVNNVPI